MKRKHLYLAVCLLGPSMALACSSDDDDTAPGDGDGDGDGTGAMMGDGDGDTGGTPGDGDGDTGGTPGDGDGDTGGTSVGGDGGAGGMGGGSGDLASLCTTVCTVKVAEGCPGDSDQGDCEDACEMGAAEGCESEWLARISCEATLDADDWECNPNMGGFLPWYTDSGQAACGDALDDNNSCVGR